MRYQLEESKNNYFATGDLGLDVQTRLASEQNINNLDWDRTALSIRNLRDLYAAKCLDLKIEKDANQFDKFC